MNRKRLRELAQMLSDVMDESLDGGKWRDMIDGLDVTPEEKGLLRDRVRWTLIDEENGDDLLGVSR